VKEQSKNRVNPLALTLLILAWPSFATDQLIYDCTFTTEGPKMQKEMSSRRFRDGEPVQVTLRDFTFVVDTVRQDSTNHLQLKVIDACGNAGETSVAVGYPHPSLTFRQAGLVAQSECWYKPDGH